MYLDGEGFFIYVDKGFLPCRDANGLLPCRGVQIFLNCKDYKGCLPCRDCEGFLACRDGKGFLPCRDGKSFLSFRDVENWLKTFLAEVIICRRLFSYMRKRNKSPEKKERVKQVWFSFI